jgi:DNA-binding transcriptional LysR family regulator
MGHDMKSIQFRWIEAFRAVASTGSTIDAAQLLGLDQSAVSRHIASLEGQLGVQLFDRRQRSLKLSDVGEQLLPEAEGAISALVRFQRKAHAIGLGESGLLHVVTSATLARGLLPKAIGAFSEEASDVTVHVEVVSRVELERKIESQEFDVCATALPIRYPTEHMVHLGKFSGVCLLPRRHHLARADIIRLQDLRKEKMIGLPLGTVGRMRIDELFNSAGLRFQPTVETTAVALNELVATGSGIAITDPLTARAASTQETIAKPLVPTINYEFALLFPISRSHSPAAASFAQILQRCLAN